MRLEFQPSVSTFPLVENEVFEDLGSVSPDFDSLLERGISAARTGEREHARKLLTHASTLNPTSEDAWIWLASISDYPEELLAFLNNVLEINPENDRALEWRQATCSLLAKTFVQRAVAAHEEGADELAQQCLDQALVHDIDSEMAWFWKASLAKNDDHRLELLEHVLSINPENQDAYNAAESIRGVRSKAAFADAKTAAVAGKRKKALELVDEFLRSVPDNAEAWILRSHLSIGIADKLKSLESALEADPANTTARSGYDFLKATFSPEPDEPEIVSPEPLQIIEIDEISFAEPAMGTFDTSIFDAGFEQPTSAPELIEFETDEPKPHHACPFCAASTDLQAFACSSCNATLSLSDLESLLSNTAANHEIIQQAVTEMEAEWNLREFSEKELTDLGVGHFNLRNFEDGLKYVQEASRLNPNNVILSGQVNTAAIRLEELRRQNEVHELMPKGKTILVVDDSATVRKLISGKLEKSGHNVVCAVDGVEALERLADNLPDLVLLDITMPRMDGYEVCRQIRANPAAKDLPVVMISGKDGFFDKVRGRMAGTTGYVTKPFGPETLMKALETYLLPESDAVN